MKKNPRSIILISFNSAGQPLSIHLKFVMEYYLSKKVVIITKERFVVRGVLNQVTQGEVFLADYNMAPMANLEEYVCKGSDDDLLIIPKCNVISMCKQ